MKLSGKGALTIWQKSGAHCGVGKTSVIHLLLAKVHLEVFIVIATESFDWDDIQLAT